MLDLNSLPFSGGLVAAALLWTGVSGLALGPLVAYRTIETSGWQKSCESTLHKAIAEEAPGTQSMPSLSCDDMMGMFIPGGEKLCRQGAGRLFDRMLTEPLAGQRQALRRRAENRRARIAKLAPSRCSCAASLVAADRVTWGVYAGTARLAGGPKDIHSDLTRALHSSACAVKLEG